MPAPAPKTSTARSVTEHAPTAVHTVQVRTRVVVVFRKGQTVDLHRPHHLLVIAQERLSAAADALAAWLQDGWHLGATRAAAAH